MYQETLRAEEAEAQKQKILAVAGTAIQAYNDVLCSVGQTDISVAAKQLKIGISELVDILVQEGWIYRRGGNLIAFQDHIEINNLSHYVEFDGFKKKMDQAKLTPQGLMKLNQLIHQKYNDLLRNTFNEVFA